jgi:hypothetical protein
LYERFPILEEGVSFEGGLKGIGTFFSRNPSKLKKFFQKGED